LGELAAHALSRAAATKPPRIRFFLDRKPMISRAPTNRVYIASWVLINRVYVVLLVFVENLNHLGKKYCFA
jgi:hypothetical protein